MIVSCPSCGTRYRHQSESAVEAVAARCSHCDDMVPLVVAGRPYLIMPASAAERTGMAIGMDDPRLADQLKRTAFDAGPEEMPGVISCRIAADEPAHAPKSGSWARRFSGTNGSAPAIFDRRRSWLVSSRARGLRKPARKERAQPAAGETQSRSKALEVGIASVLTVVGAATAYFSAAEQGLNPMTWTIAGGGLGLFMAWICLKWTRQH